MSEMRRFLFIVVEGQEEKKLILHFQRTFGNLGHSIERSYIISFNIGQTKMVNNPVPPIPSQVLLFFSN